MSRCPRPKLRTNAEPISDIYAPVLGLSARLSEHPAAKVLKQAIKNYSIVNMQESKTVVY